MAKLDYAWPQAACCVLMIGPSAKRQDVVSTPKIQTMLPRAGFSSALQLILNTLDNVKHGTRATRIFPPMHTTLPKLEEKKKAA